MRMYICTKLIYIFRNATLKSTQKCWGLCLTNKKAEKNSESYRWNTENTYKKRRTGTIPVSTDGGKNIPTFFANVFPLYIDFFSAFSKPFYVYAQWTVMKWHHAQNVFLLVFLASLLLWGELMDTVAVVVWLFRRFSSSRFLWPVGEAGRGRSQHSAALLPLFRPCTRAPPPGDSPRCTGAWSRRNTRPPPCAPPSAWPRTCSSGCGWCWGQRVLSEQGRLARRAGLPCPEAPRCSAGDGRCTQC